MLVTRQLYASAPLMPGKWIEVELLGMEHRSLGCIASSLIVTITELPSVTSDSHYTTIVNVSDSSLPSSWRT
jgi:hypothetical protein